MFPIFSISHESLGCTLHTYIALGMMIAVIKYIRHTLCNIKNDAYSSYPLP